VMGVACSQPLEEDLRVARQCREATCDSRRSRASQSLAMVTFFVMPAFLSDSGSRPSPGRSHRVHWVGVLRPGKAGKGANVVISQTAPHAFRTVVSQPSTPAIHPAATR